MAGNPLSPAAPSSWQKTVKMVLIGLGLGLVLGGGGALKVYLSGADALDASEAKVAEAQAAVTKLEARQSLLRVNLHLQRALSAFDAQNFGVCDEQLTTAKGLMAGLDAAAAGADPAKAEALQKRLARAKVEVGLDLVAQRADLVSLVAASDALIDG